jgi:hypothetical protein
MNNQYANSSTAMPTDAPQKALHDHNMLSFENLQQT